LELCLTCEELVGLLTGDDVNELVYVVIFSCNTTGSIRTFLRGHGNEP